MIRIGIDVGGTFTKGVAIDDETYEIAGKSAVLTTHSAPEGVAKGVVLVLDKILKGFDIDPKDVTFLAHSTTQATNALLEGDVAPVGIVGLGKGAAGYLARKETAVGNIELAPGRMVRTYYRFLDSSSLSEETIKRDVQGLVSEGAKVVLASEAFGVDDPKNELLVMDVASKLTYPAVVASDISKLYGLTVRTRTAAINASILPKMMETANMIEQSMKEAGIKAPLMIMRGDGGVMIADEMRRRPILTALSGPAASVAGALMYLKVSDGIFFEVGGTSTNIGVIRNGKPMIKYVQVGGHSTFVNSLDVRVIGVAGGSMVRARNGKILDVGPRSAHIAGLSYAAFAETEEIMNPELIFIKPRSDDPEDYVAIRTASGKILAVTNTCAANALGLTKPGDYAYGNPEAAKKALKPLAEKMGLTVEETSQEILKASSTKITTIIDKLTKEYELEKEHVVLVGGGGGAASLIPFVARTMGMKYKISENAEVISSIGVALAMVRDMVERMIVNPTSEDLLRIKKEAEELAMKAGAMPETIEVFTEIDSARGKVRAIATGANELRTHDFHRGECTLEEMKSIAGTSMGAEPEKVHLVANTEMLFVFGAEIKGRSLGFLGASKKLVRVIDKRGAIRLQASNAIVVRTSVRSATKDVKTHFEKNTTYRDEGPFCPRTFILFGGRVSDLSGLKGLDQVVAVTAVDLQGLEPDRSVVLIFLKG